MQLEVYRLERVCTIVGATPSTIWRWIRSGEFPPPIRIGKNMVGWRSDRVQDWIESRPIASPQAHVLPRRATR
jgi:prophage regulatory protein